MVAISLTLLLTVASFAVDLGFLRVARQDMQAVADMVALDMARELDGRSAAAIASDMEAAKSRSVARNDTAAGLGLTVSHQLGQLSEVGFVEVSGASVPDAVRVTAATDVDYFLRPGTGSTARSAVSSAESEACFSLGSYAAAVRTGTSPLLGPLLSGLLGSNVELTAGDLDGLAAAHITLLGLIDTGLGAGTVNELIGLEGIKVGDLFLAVADVLERESGDTASVQLLRFLAVKVGGVTIDLLEILALESGKTSGLGGTLNVLDLVATSLFVANGTNALALPDLDVNLGSPVNLDASLQIIQKPNQACGRTGTALSTSQVELKLSGDAAGLDLGIFALRVGLDVTVELAPAAGTLKSITCEPGKDTIVVILGDGLLRLRVALDTKISLLADLIKVAEGPIVLSSTRSRPEQDVTVTAVNGDYRIPGSVGPGSLGVPNLHADASQFKILGLPAGWGLQPLLDLLLDDIVNPLVQGLDSALLTPLLEFLGIQVAGADIHQLPEATCGRPALRG